MFSVYADVYSKYIQNSISFFWISFIETHW